MKPFQQNIWMLSLVSWIGALAWMVGGYELAHGTSAAWLVATAFFYFLTATALSVGYHRLFTHRSYQCGAFWHYLFGAVGTVVWHGSPIQWVALHITHHRESDGPGDPHFTGPTYMLHKRYRPVRLDLWRTRRLLRSRFHLFIHEWYVLIALAFMYGLLLIDYRLALFGYLMPMGLAGFVGGLHQTIAHGWGRDIKFPRNLPILEFVIPSMGEWMHANHHRNSRAASYASRWWHLDMGAWVVTLIRSDRVPA